MAPFIEELADQLAKLDLSPQFAFGFDFARVADLTTGSLMAIEQRLKRREVLAFELRNVPGDEQKLIVKTVLDHVRSRLVGAAFDATGMGWTVAEDMGRCLACAKTRKASGIVIAVKFSEEWYRLHMPPLKAAFEDDSLALIRDVEHVSDLRTDQARARHRPRAAPARRRDRQEAPRRPCHRTCPGALGEPDALVGIWLHRRHAACSLGASWTIPRRR